jgi:hypothetical protein
MYIGNDLQVAESGNKIIDDISSSFNGSTTSFALLVGGSAPVPFPINTQQIYISVNGVIQEPDPTGSAGFKLLGNNIVFSSAPANGHAFFGVILSGADYVTVGTEFPAGSATAPSITFGNDNNTGLYSVTGGTMGFTSDGVQTFTLDGDGFKLPDNKKLFLGSSSDLEVFHDGSNSYIKDTGTGGLIIRSNDLNIEQADGGGKLIRATESSDVELYFNGTNRFQTTNTGTNVTGIHVDDGATHDGDVTFTGAAANVVWDKSADDLIFYDNATAAFGTGGDLKIYHNGSDSYIDDSGTGALTIRGSATYIQNYGTEMCAKFMADGAVELYHNNVKKLNTESWGVTIQDDLKIIGAEGSHAQIRLVADEGDDNPDNWRLRAGDGNVFYLQNYGDGAWETNIRGIGGGTIELYHNNALQCYTFDTGLKFNDDKQIRLGTDDDMRMFHDNAQGIINNATGILKVRSDELHLAKTDNEIYLKGVADGAVELYYDNTKRFETNSTGAKFIGNLYGDDNAEVRLGDSGDFQLFHNSASGEGRIYNSNAAGLVLISNLIKFQNNANNETMLTATADGAVELYHNNNKKLETSTYGTTLTGNLFLADSSDGNWGRIKVGTGEDLQIYHDGSHSNINNSTGNLRLQTDALRVNSQDNNESIIRADKDGAVELYYDNVKKLETTSAGATITGPSDAVATLYVKGAEGRSAEIQIAADEGDDYTDTVRIHQSTNGNLYIQNNTASGTWETMILAAPNGAVQLYHNNAVKLETGGNGVEIKNGGVKPFIITAGEAEVVLDSTGSGSTKTWRVMGSTGGDTHKFRIYDEEAGADRFNIDSNGNVIIGTNSWSYPKALNAQGSSGSILSLYNADTTTYAADTSSAIEFKLLTGNTGNQTGTCEIRAFKENGTNGNNARGLSFWTAGNGGANSEKLRIQSGGGISFNGDSAAANALDDYEEGDYEPVVTPASNSFTSITMHADTGGSYTKIGNLVRVMGCVRWTGCTFGSASGNLHISLPFTVAARTNGDNGDTVGPTRTSTWNGSLDPRLVQTKNNTSLMNVFGGDRAENTITVNGEMDTLGAIQFSIVYNAA